MNGGTLTTRLFRAVLVAAVLVLALALGLIVGLTPAQAASSPSPSQGQTTLRIGWTSEPDNLNPFIGFANTSYEIWAINYDFLFGFGTQAGAPTLDLAREFPTRQNGGISADGKVWTIKLRPGVKWSDGRPLTAEDVAFTYNYVVKNQMLNMFITTLGITGAKALAPDTVQIDCSQPKADMEHIFLPILPKHIWARVNPQKAQTDYVSQLPLVGSGPFVASDFKKGSYLKMVRNPYYWGKEPAVDEIIFETYQNADTMVADLRSGALDAAWGIPEAQFKQLSSQTGVQTTAYNFFNWDYIDINCCDSPVSQGNPVLRDRRFRDALNYAVDRDQLCQLAYEGLATPGTTIAPPATWSNPDYHWQPPASQAYVFDLQKANQLLDAAGYPRGPDGLRRFNGKPIDLRLWTATDFPQSQTEAKLIAGWLHKLGLKVTLSVLERGAIEAAIFNFKGKQLAPDYDLIIDDWAGYGDPGQTFTAFTTAAIGGMNEPAWSNATFDKLDERQATALDPAARKNLIDQMQQVFYQQSPQIVLVYPQYLEAYSTSRWTGWTPMFGGRGPAFMTTGNVDSYVNLKPLSSASSGRHASGIWIALATLAIAVFVIVWVLLRRRQRPEEV
jgi:peptide/nickel transport system substrate-binding protein